jgi:eukaryotic-like serine/threonine-protein kinase
MNHPHDIMSTTMLQIGDQIDQFQVQAYIAQGGTSTIYRAYDLITHQEVALKIPDASAIGDPAQFERFQREIEVSRQLNHPAVLHGLHTGQYNRMPYLVMELINGKSMRQLIETSAPLPLDKSIDLIRKVADGLIYCHEQGIIHRDLKPENILINEEGQPVIMDFGLALVKSSRRVTYSNLSVTMGTPDYMAPEQVEGQRGDARTDIYALGLIFFELLSGTSPYTGVNNMAVMAQHLNYDAPRLDHIRSDVSPQLAATIARCLCRNPQDRFADMQSLLHALDHPDSMDITLLDHLNPDRKKNSWFRALRKSPVFFAILLFIFIILFAFVLQSIR